MFRLSRLVVIGMLPWTCMLVWIDGAIPAEEGEAMAAPSGVERGKRGPANLFVSSSTGDDSNTGTKRTEPLRSIKAAMLRAKPGSTITLLPGWYEGGIVLPPGTEGRPLTLRAERRGRVFIGRPRILSGFQRAEGWEYTYITSAESAPASLTEVDTGKTLRYMATVVDVEELAGTYCFDEVAKRLYVHPTDSAGVAHHVYSPLGQGIGVTLADYTVVDGLVFTGFGQAAVLGDNPTRATVQNCIAYGNGYAISFKGGRDCVIRGNVVWGNKPAYNEGAQIHIGGAPPAEGFLIENNIAYDSPQIGIRFYSGTARNCMTRGNLTYGNALGGFFYKMNDSEKLFGERNVSVGNANNDYSAPEGGHNTYGSIARDAPKETDLRIGQGDWKFADPAYHDYRLQSDSPARGEAPDESDLGAFRYDGAVVFVKPDGDDAKEGTSVAAAWRTLAHATRLLKPGQTLYIGPGEWKAPLVLSDMKATAEKPTVIRVHGKGKATFSGIRVEKCAHLKLEHLRVADAALYFFARPNMRKNKTFEAGIAIQNSEAITLLRCASYGGQVAGVSVSGSKDVSVESCNLSGNGGPGLDVDAHCADVELVSSIISANLGPQVRLAARIPGFYSEFNAFATSKDSGMLGQIGQQRASGLDTWRELTGMDSESLMVEASEFAAPEQGDFRVRAGEPIAFAGRYARPVGPEGVFVTGRIERGLFEHVKVLSTTRTSANITWWTPGRVCGTVIEWGNTAEYGDVHERASEGWGEYETFHTVSLLSLEPETTYHFRVGFRDFFAGSEEKVDGQDPIRWSRDYTFTTAAKDPEPRLLYISLEGDNTNDGLSPRTAWRTLHKAASEARAGDTVTIASGRYMELLRPLQTGVGPDRRITFRAERPLTVFLDGGFIKFVQDGRSHCIQILNKAYITVENLVCERVQSHDNGGYRGGLGYSGLIGISGSAGIKVKNCIMDGRYRWMPCMWVFEAGKMPGVPDDLPAFTVTDSLLLHGWRSLGIQAQRPCVFRNNAFVRALTGMVTVIGGTRPKSLVMRNNIFQSLIFSKRGNVLFGMPSAFDSDYNCFAWDPENESKFIADIGNHRESPNVSGLEGWQRHFLQDRHGIEFDPGYPLSRKMGFGVQGKVSQDPLEIGDLILPPDSPCRGRGENGEDIGPRWERFLPRKP